MTLVIPDEDVLLEAIGGSRCYNLHTPVSDTDIRGITFSKLDYMLDLSGRQMMEISDEAHNAVYYDLSKFMHLAEGCNPNIVEMLFAPPESIIRAAPEYQLLVNNRRMFISKLAMNTYLGYAEGQFNRAKSLGKKGNMEPIYTNDRGLRLLKLHLQWLKSQDSLEHSHLMEVFGGDCVAYLDSLEPVDGKEKFEGKPLWEKDGGPYWEDINGDVDVVRMRPPSVRQYIYKYRNDPHGYPFRPELWPYSPTIGESKYDVASVEHMPNAYRLYRNGSGFINRECTQIYCHDISPTREKEDFDGIIIVNFDQYTRDLKEWRSFWVWMNERNQARYSRDWNKNTMVDNKSLMHTMRLLISAESIARCGVPRVRFEGDDREFLMDIRNGQFSYETIMKMTRDKIAELRELFPKCDLPAHADGKKVKRLYMEIMFKRFKKEIDEMGFEAWLLKKDGDRPEEEK